MNNQTNQQKKEYLEYFFNQITQYLTRVQSPHDKVLDYRNPEQLRQELDLEVKPDGEGMEALLASLEQYFRFSVHTDHKLFFNQFFSGRNLPAFIGEVMAAATNTSMYTYEAAPVATLIENEMIAKMCSIAGFTEGDGMFLTGGSNANMIAMFSARNRKVPQSKTEGLSSMARLSAFVSEQAHYSLETSANLLGIGSRLVYKVRSDDQGRMIPEDLENKINESVSRGEVPFFVAATAGTTMLGAFDPIEEVAALAHQYGLWMHVDGALGGSLILGSQGKQLFKGLQQADSFAWDAHKLMNIPLMCSVLLTRGKGRFRANLTDLQDDYLFHDTEAADLDLGKKSIQCGRRVDALKLWTAWKYFGDTGYQQQMDKLLDLAAYFEQKVRQQPRLEMMAPRQTLIVCFRYLSNSSMDIDLFNETLRDTLRREGKIMVNYGTLGDSFSFRWVVANPEVEKQDIDRFFELLLSSASELEAANVVHADVKN